MQTGDSTVRFASWSDADYGNTINDYIDQKLSTYLRANFGVRLRRVPLNATADAVASVTRAAAAGVTGSIDLIWINGKNFKARGERGVRRWGVRDMRAHASAHTCVMCVQAARCAQVHTRARRR